MANLAECERNFMASNAASAGIRIATLVITARLYSYVPKAWSSSPSLVTLLNYLALCACLCKWRRREKTIEQSVLGDDCTANEYSSILFLNNSYEMAGIASYLFFSVNLSPSPLISSMKLSLVTAILHETVQQLFFLLPNEVQPRLLPLHSAEQGLHLADRLHPSSGESLQTFFIGTRLLA